MRRLPGPGAPPGTPRPPSEGVVHRFPWPRPQAARRDLADLAQLLADGCRSELEIWGCLHVLRAPGMPAFVQQREVVVAGVRHVLDACDEVLLAVEMDGAAWHGTQEQREADLRRDALVATIGRQTLRFRLFRKDDVR